LIAAMDSGAPLKHVLHVVHMSLSMLGVFIAYSGLQNLVSSILGKLGYWCIATIYIAFSFSALIVGPSVVDALGSKLSLFVGALCYSSFIIANLWPRYETLIPTAAALGIGASILWTAEGSYLTTAAANYALKKNKERRSAMGLFNGIFFALFQINQVVGNLISGFILSNSDGHGSSYQVLMYTYISIAGVATLTMLLIPVETAPASEETGSLNSEEQKVRPSILSKIFRALLLLKDPKCFLLIPIMFYSGIEQAFVAGDFTSAIIAESVGRNQIGFVMAVFGVFNVLFSFLFGRIADKLGSGYLVILGFFSHMLFLTLMLIAIKLFGVHWFADRIWLLYLAAIVWAAGDAAWNTFPNTILGINFTDNIEAAFANLKFWQAVGSAVPFILGAYIELDLKIVCVAGFQILGAMGVLYLHNFVSPLQSNKRQLI